VRILLLAPESPVPANSGVRLRMLHLMRALAEAADLEVAVLGEVPAHDEPYPILGTRAAPPRARALAASLTRPYLAARHTSPDLARIARAAAPDTVQAEFPYLVPAARHAHAPVVLDAHNVESELARTFAASERRRLRRARWRWEADKLGRFEGEAIRSVDAVAATSESDAAALAALGAREVVVVPNGVDTGAIRFAPCAEGALVVYVANFGYLPNVVAARDLVEHVLPRLRAAIPAATLRLVGRNAPMRWADARAGVEVAPDVDDVVPHLHAARVSIVPLRAGSGTRLKALEAMAAGVPVVSTALGVAGLEVRDGEHVLLAESPAELAEAASEVLRDASLGERLAEAGRALVESTYDWSLVSRPLVDLHRRLAGGR
jgi:glycosyltransferase involved in cell wall biosynthesis